MSHFTQIGIKITNLEALKRAAEKMGFKLDTNTMCRYYFGEQHMDAVVKLPGIYDIGLTKANKEYTMSADLFKGDVERYVGTQGNRLLREYAVEQARGEAHQRGFSIMSEEVKGTRATLVVLDPETGGKLNVVCDENGKIHTETTGFQGDSCMKFKEMEEALGAVEETGLTSEYYATVSQNDTVDIRNL